MSPSPRAKSRPNTDVCGDCSASDPTWVSVNRGILLCTECCSVHRSLGRHISQIASLYKSQWNPAQLSMIMALNSGGVNSIWEHTLLDTNTKTSIKKPQPKDPLHPTKSTFIRMKHEKLTWAIKGLKSDGPENSVNELGQQLHASARSSNLHTSARLLAQGADANYFHEEKGSTPLHVAAKSNQASQIELLLIYGADPCIPDVLGRTTVEVARQAGNIELVDRLTEACFQLTDRLTYFLCNRKPDHKAGQHLLVPDIKDIDASIIQRSKLQMLSNRLFEELAMDVYDEIDRREIENIWKNTPGVSERSPVPFLPVHPQLSTTRNQARQKLARLTSREFNAVVLDVLTDARRRQQIARFNQLDPQINLLRKDMPSKHISQISDDEPLYDSVASDDDYAALTPIEQEKKIQSPVSVNNTISTISQSDLSQGSIASTSKTTVNVSNTQLADQLRQSNSMIFVLREEVNALRTLVEKLSLENCDLRSRLHHPNVINGSAIFSSDLNKSQSSQGFKSIGDISSLSPSILHLHSTAIETCSDNLPQLQSTENSFNNVSSSLGNGHDFEIEPVQDVRQGSLRSNQRPASMYETRDRDWQSARHQQREETARPNITQSLYQYPENSLANHSLSEEINRCTNQVTKRIQELWGCIQVAGRKDAAVPCAEHIRIAVADLTAIVTQINSDEDVRAAVKQLVTGTARLQIECAGLQRASALSEYSPQTDTYLHLVRTCAYDIAKATKVLVTKFEKRT